MAVSAITSLKFNLEIQARFQRLAETRRRSAYWLMHKAVKQYFDRE